jgi:hypothetical protein
MRALSAFCLATVAFLVLRDLFSPEARDVEVWLGFELRGRAALVSAPIHWLVFGVGAWAFWTERPWILPAAAAYAFYVALSHLVWSEASPDGDGWPVGLAQAVAFSLPGLLLLRAHRAAKGRAGAWRPERIVSGGQTGADRAAFDVALEMGLAIGGFVPRGRRAEDGPVPERYAPLVETDSDDPAIRTARNVEASDATLIVSHGPLSGGSLLALEAARRARKPVLHLDLDALSEPAAAARLREWLRVVRPHALNVAGPRASEDPVIGPATAALLRAGLDGPEGSRPERASPPDRPSLST